MSSDSHATITYTSMSSYEVIVNGCYGMLMDPLDPYVQLVMEAPPSLDYIPGPEAPPSPDYIPGPKYLEYLPPADDVLPAEEQPLPAAVSPTAESPGYITESDPEMEPEEEDGDNEKSDDDSIEYPTSGGDDDADDDGHDLSEDDADDEDEEESLDSEGEEEEHLATTVLAPALYSSVSASKETEPFEEGKTAATPPPFGYRVAARISVQPHILMPFHSDESIPEADIPLRKRARFTTPIGGYETEEREAIFLHLVYHLCIGVTQIEALQRDVSTLQRQHINDKDILTRHIQHENAQRDVAPEDGDRVAAAMAEAEASRVRNGYGSNGSGPRLTQAVRECTYPDFLKCQPLNFKGTEGVIGLTQWFKKIESVFNISNCTAACQVKYDALPWKTLKKMMIDKYYPRGEIKKLEIEMCELKTKGTDVIGPKPLCSKCDYHHEGPCPPRCNNCKRVGHLTRDYRSRPANANNNNNTINNNRNNNNNNQKGNGCYECGAQGHFKRNCPKLRNNNRGNQGRNDNAQVRVYVVGNTGANPDNVVAGTFLLNNRYAYILFDTGADRSFVSTTFSSQINIAPIALDHQYNVEIADGRIIGLNTIMRDFTLNFLNHLFNIDLLPVELDSFDVIVGMDWLSKYDAT
nr:hypothetical protein [Tanacetum cinerariifolium]